MSYALYQIQFDAPVHFGNAELGGKLEQIGMEYPADTLFSALCCELAQQKEWDLLEILCLEVETGDIVFSDLFPYSMTDTGDCRMYLPKPVLTIESPEVSGEPNLQVVRQEASLKKRQKKMNYLRVCHFTDYFQALSVGKSYVEDAKFGMSALMERVNCRGSEPLPYYVGQFAFEEKAGLYGIIRLKDDTDMEWLLRLLQALGASGIGGKRSSGYGKFHLAADIIMMDEAGVYEDDAELYRMLCNTQAQWQMNISIVLPRPEDIAVVKQGQYTLRKRSGFVTQAADPIKRDSIYMLRAGSCLPQRISGQFISFTGVAGHPVYRCGKGLYVGLP